MDLHATYFPIFTNNYMLDESISVLGLSEMLDTQEKMNEESGYQPQADPTPMDIQVSYSYHIWNPKYKKIFFTYTRQSIFIYKDILNLLDWCFKNVIFFIF